MRDSRIIPYILMIGIAAGALAEGAMAAGRGLDNIALGKPYTMKPEPSYALCTDEDDRIQLTDGDSFGSSWTKKTTVGWSFLRSKVLITIDLGSVQPIGGVSYATAARLMDVGWPAGIFILVSDDGKRWHFLGDLTAFGAFDDALTEDPDTENFDLWVGRWPGARRYAVSYDILRDNIGVLKRGTPAYDRAVGEWIRFWVNHAGRKGIKAEQILLLLVDEPGNRDMDQLTIDCARPIRAAGTGALIWTDPTHSNPADALPELWKAADIVCPRRVYLWSAAPHVAEFYRQQASAGHRLELYDCSAPGFAMDPYSYHRLLAWSCFDMGATGMNVWFVALGRGRAWNDYMNNSECLAAVFLGPDSVTAAKHMEAVREGVQDYECLVMLRNRISQMEKVNPAHPALAKAKNLLGSVCSRVLTAQGALDTNWPADKDRSIADQVVAEVGEMLEQVGKP